MYYNATDGTVLSSMHECKLTDMCPLSRMNGKEEQRELLRNRALTSHLSNQASSAPTLPSVNVQLSHRRTIYRFTDDA